MVQWFWGRFLNVIKVRAFSLSSFLEEGRSFSLLELPSPNDEMASWMETGKYYTDIDAI